MPPPTAHQDTRFARTQIARACTVCQVRWAQQHGTCRHCARLLGHAEALAPVDGRQRYRAHLRPRPDDAPDTKAPREPLVRTFDGQDYEVVFDGTVNR